MLAILLGPQYTNPTDDEYSSREQGQYHGDWCPGSLLRQFRHIQYFKYLWHYGIGEFYEKQI